MKIVWNEQSLRWFQNASEYTGYNRKLAKILLERSPCRGSLCDLGCGAGLIDFELAPHFGEISCVDISMQAVDSVRSRAAKLGLKNISAVCMDARELSGQWETVIALFHGGEYSLAKYLSLASDRLIIATHGESRGNFGPPGKRVHKCFTAESVKSELDELGLCYSHDMHRLEYGQPFSSPADARAFVEAYSTAATGAELDSYLEEKLVRTGDRRFPLYLPNLKSIGIFVIRRDENERA